MDLITFGRRNWSPGWAQLSEGDMQADLRFRADGAFTIAQFTDCMFRTAKRLARRRSP